MTVKQDFIVFAVFGQEGIKAFDTAKQRISASKDIQVLDLGVDSMLVRASKESLATTLEDLKSHIRLEKNQQGSVKPI